MNFQEVEYAYQVLEQKWSTRQIDEPGYRQQLNQLRATGPSGEVWMVQAHTGRWFVYHEGQWVDGQRTPIRLATAAPAQPPQRPQPAKPKNQKLGLLAVIGVVGLCLVCGVAAAGGYLVYSGKLSLPGSTESGVTQVEIKQKESLPVPADGAAHADSNGVTLQVPSEALESGGQVNLTANDLSSPWLKDIKSAVSIDTPFYNLSAVGKNDTPGSLTLSFPAQAPGSRILAVIDNEYMVELAQAPQDGKLVLQTRAGPSDASDLTPPDGYDGSGSIYYAVISPKSSGSVPSSARLAALSAGSAQDVDERNCIPDLSIIGGAAVNLCRQNAAGTIQVMLPTTQRDLVSQVDLMVDKIETVMKKYADLGFSTAQLSKSSPMLVRVSTKITSPSYYPLNGVLYIPVDSVAKIATQSPTDVYHEMAHWIQAVKYSTRLAYYSGERTWWLETSAENMVMLVEPSYVGSNLLTYGTISNADNTLALQSSPYQWPGDYYVQAQLVKVNLCDGSACPLSVASFAKAISEGTYPLMDGGKKGMISANLMDYAFYLLGKSPSTANTGIPLTGPVKTGEGYGEYVRITRTTDTDLKYDYNGSDPQMRKETIDGVEGLTIEAKLQQDGVYPLMVKGAEGNNPGLPVELKISPGASFYYTIDDGDLQYSDGSQELIIRPIHGIMGIKKVRIVAMGVNGGEVLKAQVKPLDLQGAWVVSVSGEKTGGSVSCATDGEGFTENPDATGQLMAYFVTLTSGLGDMTADSTGRSLDWSLVSSRIPAQMADGGYTYQATALLAGDAIKYQGKLDIPKPAESSSSIPPAAPAAAAAVIIPGLWFSRKHLNPKTFRVFINVLVIGVLTMVSTGCFGFGMYGSSAVDAKLTKIEYIGGQDTGNLNLSGEGMAVPTGKPIWQMTGSGTYTVDLTMEATSTDENGTETTETSVCTGTVTYPITVYVYKDFSVTIPSE